MTAVIPAKAGLSWQFNEIPAFAGMTIIAETVTITSGSFPASAGFTANGSTEFRMRLGTAG